ncbi:MAG TPA: hypothetical protein VMM78_17190 [Thermomicrobiales bacterium]|nr:hypothetical protein [Thermomicrobiales bacterium]
MDTFTASPEAAIAFYDDLTDPNARAMVDFLRDRAGQRFEAREIMTALGFARHSDVARAAFAVGEAARQHGLTRPWNEAQLGYMMAPETADLLERAS